MNNISVSAKPIEKWDKSDMLKWIKCLQEKKLFEKSQADIMCGIINKKNLNGKKFAKCYTTKERRKFFKKKINEKTAQMLTNSVRLEFAMYVKRNESINIIIEGKWIPRVDEKIRAIDTKYKPLRSYVATIKKVQNEKILISYDGYPNSDIWIEKREWQDRITILEDINNVNKTVFKVGQKVEAKDGKGWYNAIIKKIEINVTVRWLDDKWASERFDKFYRKSEYIKIRHPITHHPSAVEDIMDSFEIKKESAIQISDALYTVTNISEIKAAHTNQAINVIHTSVNTKQIEEWDISDMLQWIKVLQDRHEFEGSESAEANQMIKIINERKLTGRTLKNCETIKSLVDLFESKIKKNTGVVLRNSLNLEREMWKKRKLSQIVIKMGKWSPQTGEKIRLVDTKYKPFRSYPSTIKKVMKKQIFVCYDGYDDSQGVWLKTD
eukprot:500496_1